MRILIKEGQLREAVDFQGFMEKEMLCPYLFHENLKMRSDIAESLMATAKDFYDFLNLEWLGSSILFDVQLVGSLASYNWSETYSDIDLHIVLDFSKISPHKDLVEEDMWAHKNLYNQEHDITIKGFPVEVYAQDTGEKVRSNGIFSVMRQTWLKKPERTETTIDKKRVAALVAKIEAKIRKAISEYRQGNYDMAQELADTIMEEVQQLRKFGLEHGGEFSAENLAFKSLRRERLIDKVIEIQRAAFDEQTSIDKTANEKIELRKKEMQKKSKRAQEKVGSTKSTKINQPEKGKKDGIAYKIMGRSFSSLRDTEKQLGVSHSTLNYRVNSKNPKWGRTKN